MRMTNLIHYQKDRSDDQADRDITNQVMNKLKKLDKHFECMSKYLEICTKKEHLLIDKLECKKKTGA